MSGPKVVRIVTREEVVELCHAALARVDAAISHWERVGKRSGFLDPASQAAVRERRAELQDLLATERFTPLQKTAPLVEEWLAQDMERRLEEMASAVACARRARRQLATTAASVLAACRERRLTLPEDVRATLESARPTADDQATLCLEGAVNRAFALLATTEERTGPSRRQIDLAARLSEGRTETTLDQWIQAHAPALDDAPYLDGVERQLGQLSALAGPEAVPPYSARAEEIRARPNDATRALLVDALALELKDAIRTAREAAEIARSAATARAQAIALGLCMDSPVTADAARETREAGTDAPLDATSLLALEASLAAGHLPEARAHLATIQAQLQSVTQARAAAARRDVLLRGLAELGYDVHEGMSTTWAEQGRLVLATPGRTSFGVELGGTGERLQVRVVGFEGAPRDSATDREAEVSWCSQVSQLHHLLTARGADLQVERATAPGAQPVRVVPPPLCAPREDYYEEDDHAAPRALTQDWR